jgi:hypothetical protein
MDLEDKREVSMTYKGIVKGKVIEIEGGVALPEGMHVNIIPEWPPAVNLQQHPMTLKEWLQEARQLRAQLPNTNDSVEILRQLRQRRASQ